MADVKLSQLAAVSPASVAAGAALWTFPGHVEGLKLEWLAANQLRVTSGSAYIQSLGYAVNVAAAITKTGLTLTANTWYHVYLYMNGSTPDIEVVTTAPAAAYSGSARAKTGDTSRRYLGSVRCSGTANTMLNFVMQGNTVLYRATGGGAPPFRALDNGVATVDTSVSLANTVPVTAQAAQLFIQNQSTNAFIAMSAPGDALVHFFVANKNAGASALYVDMYTDASQAVRYKWDVAPTGGGAYIDVFSYTFER